MGCCGYQFLNRIEIGIDSSTQRTKEKLMFVFVYIPVYCNYQNLLHESLVTQIMLKWTAIMFFSLILFVIYDESPAHHGKFGASRI